MKYKQVFFIWLIADAFLALGVIAFMIYEQLTSSGSKDDAGMFLLVLLLGIAFSLPSLVAMLLFHAIYSNNAAHKKNNSAYVFLILAINALYSVIGQFGFHMTGEFNYFYVGTTAAGLLAYYLVDRRIRKNAVDIEEDFLKEDDLKE